MSQRGLVASMLGGAWVEWTTVAPRFHRIAALSIFILLIVQPCRTGYQWGKPSMNWREPVDPNAPKPSFLETPDSVSVPAGKDAKLPCRVANIGDKVVSWIRKPNLSILTSGVTTFTADKRVVVLHSDGSDSWTLRISSTKLEDAGLYECQVNAEPKISHAVTLYITESHLRDSPYGLKDDGSHYKGMTQASTSPTRAQILGPSVQTVPPGATITLTCEIRGIISEGVFWRHGGRPVILRATSPGSSVGGVSVDTERYEKRATSRLTLSSIMASDSGEYTCVPSAPAAVPATVVLDVSQKGGRSAAMQGDTASGSRPLSSTTLERVLLSILPLLCAFLFSFLFHSS
ncbi:protein CEPU-1-like [Hetaerina americana]|uniref:protein CEPU-1-like n=1 Tax=Hetaerina americana TaxID=62018 RepID=UPI003A7F1DB1